MSFDQPTPSKWSPGSARTMHFVSAGTPSRRVGPRPGGREHADGAHLADLVVEHLVRVAVDVGDVRERLAGPRGPPASRAPRSSTAGSTRRAGCG